MHPKYKRKLRPSPNRRPELFLQGGAGQVLHKALKLGLGGQLGQLIQNGLALLGVQRS